MDRQPNTRMTLGLVAGLALVALLAWRAPAASPEAQTGAATLPPLADRITGEWRMVDNVGRIVLHPDHTLELRVELLVDGERRIVEYDGEWEVYERALSTVSSSEEQITEDTWYIRAATPSYLVIENMAFQGYSIGFHRAGG